MRIWVKFGFDSASVFDVLELLSFWRVLDMCACLVRPVLCLRRAVTQYLLLHSKRPAFGALASLHVSAILLGLLFIDEDPAPDEHSFDISPFPLDVRRSCGGHRERLQAFVGPQV